MKKVVKMMGVAVIACSLFVACGKDDPKDGIAVSFNGNDWEATDAIGEQEESELYLQAFQDYNSEVLPWISGVLPSTVKSVEYNSDVESGNDNWFFYYFENDNDYCTVEGYEDFPTWQPESFTESVTAIDLTALTMTASAKGQMYNFNEYLADRNNAKKVDTKKLTITITNAKWDLESDAKGGKMMKKDPRF